MYVWRESKHSIFGIDISYQKVAFCKFGITFKELFHHFLVFFSAESASGIEDFSAYFKVFCRSFKNRKLQLGKAYCRLLALIAQVGLF